MVKCNELTDEQITRANMSYGATAVRQSARKTWEVLLLPRGAPSEKWGAIFFLTFLNSNVHYFIDLNSLH